MTTFLRAVDSLAVRDGGAAATAVKRIVADDPYLVGHFPGEPIYPGVFLVESARQAVAGLLGGPVTLVAVVEARFAAPLRPGDVALLDVKRVPEQSPSPGVIRARVVALDSIGARVGHCVVDVRAVHDG
ncbi:3-hydroxyacyl-ACP dehydratase FabZ family protein [Micromonospora sp. CPCC 206061]|uniref:3-hydroxyacyl-ACP dehydratase FabZ family protein n=1 Tax=Micromonospora sp. CPCC 206061 TaxID=3122410 RepID=UPI002FF104D1